VTFTPRAHFAAALFGRRKRCAGSQLRPVPVKFRLPGGSCATWRRRHQMAHFRRRHSPMDKGCPSATSRRKPRAWVSWVDCSPVCKGRLLTTTVRKPPILYSQRIIGRRKVRWCTGWIGIAGRGALRPVPYLSATAVLTTAAPLARKRFQFRLALFGLCR